MRMRKVLMVSVIASLAMLTGRVFAQQGRGGNPGTFPAQQRPPGDPAVIERGKGLYVTTCSACHGADLRGGGMGGPNLLRSQIVLADQHGELIMPIVHGARADKGMPPLPLPDPDVIAVAEYIHSVASTSRNQGAPPATDAPPPDAIVGDAQAGQVYFTSKCASCHSPTGDLQGIGTRVPEGKALQNGWVTGNASSGGGRRGAAPPAAAAAPAGGRAAGAAPAAPPVDTRAITATVTLPGGEVVQGPVVRMDNFLITVRQADGTQRTIRRVGDTPRVVLKDPLAAHKAMLSELTEKDMHDVTAYLAGLK